VILQLTHSGHGIYEDRNGRRQVAEGWAFISVVPEDISYYYPPGGTEPWVFSWLNFAGEEGIRLWQWFRGRYGSVFPLEEQTAGRLIYDELLDLAQGRKAPNDFQASVACYRFVMALAEQLDAREKAPASVVRRAALQMQRQPGRGMAVKEFAADAGLSREHFTRLFRQEMGVSPARYRRERQLDLAADWLKRTDLPVQEIAFRTGFVSGRQLTKMFGYFFGKSPVEYRNKQQMRKVRKKKR